MLLPIYYKVEDSASAAEDNPNLHFATKGMEKLGPWLGLTPDNCFLLGVLRGIISFTVQRRDMVVEVNSLILQDERCCCHGKNVQCPDFNVQCSMFNSGFFHKPFADISPHS